MAAGLLEFPALGRLHFDPRCRAEVTLMLREIVDEQVYLRHGIELRPFDTIFDVGANIGIFSLFAHSVCGGACTIVAFEPVPATFRYLEQNAAEHGLLDRSSTLLRNEGVTRIGGPARARITFFPGLSGNSTFDPEAKRGELVRWFASSAPTIGEALGPVRELPDRLRPNTGHCAASRRRSVEVRALDARMLSTCSALPRTRAFLEQVARRELEAILEGEPIDVPMTTLGDVVRERAIERIDLLKIDVEGAELDVLDGIDDTAWPRIRQVVVEAANSDRASLVADRLRKAGFVRVLVERPAWSRELGVDNEHVYGVR